jgi:polysaccharide pyruvyl transferase WcaK-like protein
MKILLTNCWQSGNTGDIAIWTNLLKHLKKAFPEAEFLLASQKQLKWDCKQLKPFKPIYYEESKLEDAVKDADIVISQGGGYMISDGMSFFLKAFELAQQLGKLTFFNTQTIVGPINDETKELLKKVIDNATFVSPRDQGTYDLLRSVGVQRDMTIVHDTAFDIGITDYKVPVENTVKFAIRGYDVTSFFLKEIALLADMVIETMGSVIFLPVGHGEGRDDRETAKEIASYMKHEAILITEELTAEQIKSILKDGILISDRYHGIVYAVSMNTPFVALSPDIDSKMPGLLNSFNYPIPLVDKNTATAKELFPLVFNVWTNKEKYRKVFESITPEIKKESVKVYGEIIKRIKNANIK